MDSSLGDGAALTFFLSISSQGDCSQAKEGKENLNDSNSAGKLRDYCEPEPGLEKKKDTDVINALLTNLFILDEKHKNFTQTQKLVELILFFLLFAVVDEMIVGMKLMPLMNNGPLFILRVAGYPVSSSCNKVIMVIFGSLGNLTTQQTLWLS